MSETLVRIEAPHFVAGILIKDDKCVYAAPILAWTVGKTREFLSQQFRARGWRASILR